MLRMNIQWKSIRWDHIKLSGLSWHFSKWIIISGKSIKIKFFFSWKVRNIQKESFYCWVLLIFIFLFTLLVCFCVVANKQEFAIKIHLTDSIFIIFTETVIIVNIWVFALKYSRKIICQVLIIARLKTLISAFCI